MAENDPFAKPRVVVVQRLTGFKAVARRDEDGNVVLEGAAGSWLPMLEPGESLRIRSAVDDDATYVTDAEVTASEDGRRILRVATDGSAAPTRAQQRRFVRVVVPDYSVDLLPDRAENATTGRILNLSAGGARAEADLAGLAPGDHVKLGFDLPGRRRGESQRYELTGEIAWAGRTPAGRPLIGIRFVDVNEATEARIAAWVLRHQASGLA